MPRWESLHSRTALRRLGTRVVVETETDNRFTESCTVAPKLSCEISAVYVLCVFIMKSHFISRTIEKQTR